MGTNVDLPAVGTSPLAQVGEPGPPPEADGWEHLPGWTEHPQGWLIPSRCLLLFPSYTEHCLGGCL